MKKFLAIILIALTLSTLTIAITSADPFLCPVVGDGVLNADSKNGDHGVRR